MNRSDSDLLDLIHDLVTDQLEGGVRRVDAPSLQELLSSDDRARLLYVQYMQDSYHIRSRLLADPAYFGDTALSNQDAAELKGRINLSWRDRKVTKSNLLWFAAVSAALLLCVTYWSIRRPMRSDAPQRAQAQVSSERSRSQKGVTREAVATLLRSDDAVWGGSGEALIDLSRLAIGQELQLESGSAELVFDTGVEALLLAPAQLKVLGADRVSSEYGRFSARVGSSGVGFVIETPLARVTDLGTEFGVSIAESGQTEVAVFEGEVDLEFGSPDGDSRFGDLGARERLLQGEAIRIDSSGARTRVVSVDDSHLPSVRQMPPFFQRLPAIGSVRDNVSVKNPNSRKFYRIVHGGFREDCQAFVDRPHQWNGLTTEGLPRELIGADYVMPFNDDKFASDLEVEVLVTRSAAIYVLISDNVSVPNWLHQDFRDTGLDIGLDEGRNRFKQNLVSAIGPGESIDTVFSVWKQEVSMPRTVVLGSVERPESTNGYNMYGIAVVGQ